MAIITRDTPEGAEFSGKLKTVTEERVYAFSGGFPKGPDWPKKNIHTDLEFAKSCGLPTRAASGAMFEGYLTELMIDLFGENWLSGGRMELKFIAIVDVGDKLLPKAIIQSKYIEDSGVRFVMEVWCQNQHGNKVVVGTATGIVR
jgi:acyl dehydratase